MVVTMVNRFDPILMLVVVVVVVGPVPVFLYYWELRSRLLHVLHIVSLRTTQLPRLFRAREVSSQFRDEMEVAIVVLEMCSFQDFVEVS